MQKLLASLAIREMPIKATVGYRYKPGRVAKLFIGSLFIRKPIVNQYQGVQIKSHHFLTNVASRNSHKLKMEI